MNLNSWMIPKAFYKYIAKIISDLLFKKLYSLTAKVQGGPWGEKMKENAEFYDWVKIQVSNYLEFLSKE